MLAGRVIEKALVLILLSPSACDRHMSVRTPTPTESVTTAASPEFVRKLVVGDGVCVLMSSGVLRCSGSRTLTVDALVELHAAGHIEDAWLGFDSACIKQSGAVRCKASRGSLPFVLGEGGYLELPTEVVDLDWWIGSGCAVTSDGGLWCAFGNAGQQVDMRRYPLSTAQTVVLGSTTACAALEELDIRCMFEASYSLGEFASEIQNLSEYCSSTPDAIGCDQVDANHREWPAPSHGFPRARDMAAGLNFVCVLDESGIPYCFDHGQRWTVEALGGDSGFVAVHGMPPLVEIDAGNRHACGRSVDDEVWCWGANEYGQLGDGTTQMNPEHQPSPVRVEMTERLDQLVLAGDRSCVLAAGQVQCWGWVDQSIDPKPSEVAGILASEINVDFSTTCAKVGEGWKCWGADPRAPGGLADVSRVVDGTPREGMRHGCTLHKAKLQCRWGDGDITHELDGVIAVDDRHGIVCALTKRHIDCRFPGNLVIPPVVYDAPAGSAAISGTDLHGCVLTKQGEVHCWTDKTPPRRIDLPGRQNVVAAHQEFGCALDEGGSVHCWSPRGAPSRAGVGEVTELVPGNNLTCARGRAGEVWCWGRWLNDQEPPPSHEQPIRMDLPGSALEVELGNSHGCARLDDGRVFCWGMDSWGQRGRMSSKFATRPQPIEFHLQ